jgi:hypothetical protein
VFVSRRSSGDERRAHADREAERPQPVRTGGCPPSTPRGGGPPKPHGFSTASRGKPLQFSVDPPLNPHHRSPQSSASRTSAAHVPSTSNALENLQGSLLAAATSESHCSSSAATRSSRARISLHVASLTQGILPPSALQRFAVLCDARAVASGPHPGSFTNSRNYLINSWSGPSRSRFAVGDPTFISVILEAGFYRKAMIQVPHATRVGKTC